MLGFGRGTGRVGGWCCAVVGILFAVLVFVGILVVNIAGHAYEHQTFRSSAHNISNSDFPASFLGRSLVGEPSCDQQPIRLGDLIRTNHSLFEYKVVSTGGEDIEYNDAPLEDCWVEEILVHNTKNLDAPLPDQFGFFPKVQALVACQVPNIKLWSEFTYNGLDPLRSVQIGAFPTVEFTNRPPTYWAEAVLVYWWDQIAVKLTRANAANFNSTLQTVFQNDTGSDILRKSTITTSVSLSNSSSPISFSRKPSEPFSPQQQALLDNLTIANASSEFLISFYWSVNYDLGQISSDNIFGNKDLLADATDIFHHNLFVNYTYQNTPLSDGTIPGDGFRSVIDKSAAITQDPATLDVSYICWRWVRKPGLLALIDVVVPTVVLFTLILLGLYLFYMLISNLSKRRTSPSLAIKDSDPPGASGSYPSFQAVNPDNNRLIPPINIQEVNLDLPYDEPLGQLPRQQRRYSLDPRQIPTRDSTLLSPDLRREGAPADPFSDPEPVDTGATQSTEVRTLASSDGPSTSILETPIVDDESRRNSYRISPDTQELFEAHARRMEQENWLQESQFGETSDWRRRVTERRSSTDLRRMKVVK